MLETNEIPQTQNLKWMQHKGTDMAEWHINIVIDKVGTWVQVSWYRNDGNLFVKGFNFFTGSTSKNCFNQNNNNTLLPWYFRELLKSEQQ